MSDFKLVEALAWVLTLLLVFDGWSTYKIVRAGGSELNDFVEWLIERCGLYAAMLETKAASIALVWLLALHPAPAWEPWRVPALAFLSVLYLYIAANNWRVMEKQQQSTS